MMLVSSHTQHTQRFGQFVSWSVQCCRACWKRAWSCMPRETPSTSSSLASTSTTSPTPRQNQVSHFQCICVSYCFPSIVCFTIVQLFSGAWDLTRRHVAKDMTSLIARTREAQRGMRACMHMCTHTRTVFYPAVLFLQWLFLTFQKTSYCRFSCRSWS